MKKIIYLGAIGLFLLGSCTAKSGHDHEGHDHATEEHSHEGHDHDHEGHDHDHEGHDHSHEGHNHDHAGASASGDEIILPPEKAKAAGVEVSTVKPGPFHAVIKTSGQVLAAQGSESTVVAPVSGTVSFSRPLVPGMNVSRGTSLLTLSSAGLLEGDPVQKARVAYETARKEYERKQALAESRIVSEKELAQARQAYETARIAYESLGKNHTEGGQVVKAPVGGYVNNLLVRDGDYVQVGQPLVSLTQDRKLYLRADVSERYYDRLRDIESARFRTSYAPTVYDLDEMKGRLLSYGKVSENNGRYLPVTFEFESLGDIIPGSYAEIYLLTLPATECIALPRTALTEEQGSYFVYLQLDEEGYRKQPVEIGGDDGLYVQIRSGVEAGDRVVTRGAYQVKLAGATNAIPAHSHEH